MQRGTVILCQSTLWKGMLYRNSWKLRLFFFCLIVYRPNFLRSNNYGSIFDKGNHESPGILLQQLYTHSCKLHCFKKASAYTTTGKLRIRHGWSDNALHRDSKTVQKRSFYLRHGWFTYTVLTVLFTAVYSLTPSQFRWVTRRAIYW